MIIEKIGTGKSIAEAYENAKLLLAAPDEAELHQEIIQDAKKKLFGLISEPAKVRVWYEIADKPVKESKAEKPAVKEKKQSETKAAAKPREEKPAHKAAPKAPKAAPAKEEAPRSEAPAKAEAKKPVREEIEITENDGAAKYLRMIIEGMGIKEYKLTLSKAADSNEYVYTIECEEDGALIGRRGETLDSIQYLLRLSVNKGIDDDKHRKVSVNIGNYREREMTISVPLHTEVQSRCLNTAEMLFSIL